MTFCKPLMIQLLILAATTARFKALPTHVRQSTEQERFQNDISPGFQ